MGNTRRKKEEPRRRPATTAAEIRNIYSGVEIVCNQLDSVLAAQDKTAKALVVALRLISGRLEETTGA